MNDSKTVWPTVLMVLAAGIIVGAQIGKVPPVMPTWRDELDLGLVHIGWISSIVALTGAGLGAAIGMLADRVPPWPGLLAGMSILCLGGLLGASDADGAWLLLSRGIEGAGFVTVVVVAPRILGAVIGPGDRDLVFGVWSTYLPFGMAIALLLAAPVLNSIGWRRYWLANSALIAVFIVVVLMTTDVSVGRPQQAVKITGSGWRDASRALTLPGPWLLAACFLFYALQYFALMNWLPTFLIDTMAMAGPAAAVLTAAVVFSNVLGNFAGAWMLYRRVPRILLMITALWTMSACAFAIFSPLVDMAMKIPAAFLFLAVGGLLPATLLAGVPLHAPSPRHLATVMGITIQGAHSGNLLGAPVLAFAIGGSGDWTRAWIPLIICGLLGTVCIIILRGIERRQ